jgi:hypothetical protein
MRGSATLFAVALLCGCKANLANNLGGGDDVVDDAPAVTDDAPGVDAPLGPFGAPQKVGAAGSALGEDDATLSFSGLEMVFAVVNTADANRKDLFYTSRPDLASAFGPATKLAFSVNGTSEETPRFSADDLTLFFAKTNGTNSLDIFSVTRPNAGAPNFGTPAIVQGVNSAVVEKTFSPCTGNRYLVIVGQDIAEGTLGGGLPVVDANLSSAQTETGAFLTQDCLTAYFASTRPDGNTNRIYTSTRTAVGQPWSVPVVVDDFAALGGDQSDPFLSDDGRTFVLTSNVDGNNDVYISTR